MKGFMKKEITFVTVEMVAVGALEHVHVLQL